MMSERIDDAFVSFIFLPYSTLTDPTKPPPLQASTDWVSLATPFLVI